MYKINCKSKEKDKIREIIKKEKLKWDGNSGRQFGAYHPYSMGFGIVIYPEIKTISFQPFTRDGDDVMTLDEYLNIAHPIFDDLEYE